MKAVTRIQTSDGKIHESRKEALKYLEVRYANILCPIGAKLHTLKYTEILEYLDTNLEKFAELLQLKSDMNFVSDEEE